MLVIASKAKQLLCNYTFFIVCNLQTGYSKIQTATAGYRSQLCYLCYPYSFFTRVPVHFYKTPSRAKYHLATCRTVKNVSEEITISQAKELGLEPCKICKPQSIYTSGSTTNKAQGQSTTVQCSGTTKAGTRCKHMSRVANGYCFQHQPK